MKNKYTLKLVMFLLLTLSLQLFFIGGRGDSSFADNRTIEFLLLSDEKDNEGNVIPLNHTILVGSSSVYHVKAVSICNETLSVTFISIGLPSGASLRINPEKITVGPQENVSLELLLTLTPHLDYKISTTTFYIDAFDTIGKSLLSSIPITFVPVFQIDFNAEWTGKVDAWSRVAVSGYAYQNLYSVFKIDNMGNSYDDYKIQVLSAPSWLDVSFWGGSSSITISIPGGGEGGNSSLVEPLFRINTDEKLNGEVRIRVISQASIYQIGEAQQITLTALISSQGILPLDIKTSISAFDVQLGENQTVECWAYNPNSMDLSIYLNYAFITPEGQKVNNLGDGSVLIDPATSVLISPGGRGLWEIHLSISSRHHAGLFSFLYLEARNLQGRILGNITLPIWIRSIPNIDFITPQNVNMNPENETRFNITIINTGNCQLDGVLTLVEQPEDITITLSKSLISLPMNGEEEISVRATPLKRIYPGTYLVKIGFYSTFLIDNTKFDVVRGINLSVRGLPHLTIDLKNNTGYLFVRAGEFVTLGVEVTNNGLARSNVGFISIFSVSRGFSRLLLYHKEIPSLEPFDSYSFDFNWSADPSTVKLEIRMNGGESGEEYSLPVTVYTPKETKNTPQPTGNFISGVEIASAVAASAIVGALLSLIFIKNEGLHLSLWKAIIPLYSKISSEEILDNKIRRDIYQYIKRHPGEHFRSILVNLDLTNGTLAYHLYTLEREELIKSRKDGLYRRFYPMGYKVEAVTPTNGMGKIYRLILRSPGITQKEVSQTLGLPNSTVNYNIKKLHSQSLIEIKREGRYTRLYPIYAGS